MTSPTCTVDNTALLALPEFAGLNDDLHPQKWLARFTRLLGPDFSEKLALEWLDTKITWDMDTELWWQSLDADVKQSWPSVVQAFTKKWPQTASDTNVQGLIDSVRAMHLTKEDALSVDQSGKYGYRRWAT